MKTKKFVQYLNSIFSKPEKDIVGEQNAINLFFGFYRSNQVIDNRIVNILHLIEKEIIKEKKDCFFGLLIGTYLGIILGKFSKIENNRFPEISYNLFSKE